MFDNGLPRHQAEPLAIKNACMDVWFGIWAPNKIPAEITDRLSRELTKALATSALKQRFGDQGVEPAPLDTPAFRQLLGEEGKMPSTLIKERGIVVE